MLPTSHSIFPFGYLGRITLPPFIRSLLLSTLGMVAILLIVRSKDIAKIGVLGISFFGLCQLAFSQISYVLPLLLPIAMAISGWIAAERLSYTHQFVALRFSGYSLYQMMRPLLACSLMLSIFNFILISEVATSAHKVLDTLEKGELHTNPFLPLQQRGYLQYNNLYLRALKPPTPRQIDGVQGFYLSPSGQRIYFFDLNKILYREELDPAIIEGHGISFIGTSSSSLERNMNLPHLLLERSERLVSPPDQLLQFIRPPQRNQQDNYLSWNELAGRKATLRHTLHLVESKQQNALHEGAISLNQAESQAIYKSLNAVTNEAFKRIYIAIGPFTLFLLAYLSSLYYRRLHLPYLRIGILTLFLLGFIILVFWNKALQASPAITLLIYGGFHLVVLSISRFYWMQLERGAK